MGGEAEGVERTHMEVLKVLGILILVGVGVVVGLLLLYVLRFFWPVVLGIPLALWIGSEVDDNLGVVLGIIMIPLQFLWVAPRFGVQDKIDRTFRSLRESFRGIWRS